MSATEAGTAPTPGNHAMVTGRIASIDAFRGLTVMVIVFVDNRVARAILRDDAESEDVMQDAYVRAYHHLAQFAGRPPFSTWFTRIAVHESLTRLRIAQAQCATERDGRRR